VAEDVERGQNGGIECVECSFNSIAAAFRVTGRRRERERERKRERERERETYSSTTTIVVESLI